MGLYTNHLVTTPEDEVSLSLGIKELTYLTLKRNTGKKGLFIKRWSSNLIWDTTTLSDALGLNCHPAIKPLLKGRRVGSRTWCLHSPEVPLCWLWGATRQSQAPLPFNLVPAKINKWKDLSPGKISSLMCPTRLEEGGNRYVSGWRQRERGRWKGGEDRTSLSGSRLYSDR